MGTIIRRVLAALLVTAVVWCAVVFWWQAAGTSPGVGDLVMWLLLVPALLVGGYWLWRWRRDRKQAAAPAAADPAADELAETPPLPDRVLHLRAAALHLRAGNSAADVAEALVEPQRPGLHPSLRDAAGLPVHAAPVEGIDGEAMRDVLLAIATDPDAVAPLLGEEVLRAFALLQPVAEELLLAACPTAPAEAPIEDGLTGRDGLHPHAMAHSRSVQAAAPAPRSAPMQVRALLPAGWPAPLRQLAGDWLQAQAAVLGHRPDGVVVNVQAATGPTAAWQLLEQIGEAVHGDAAEPGETHLLLAAQSLIGETSIEQLDARSRLLSSGRNEGLIPGEGAAGLWLAAADAAPGTPPTPRLHRPMAAKPATTTGHRAATRRASALLTRAAETAAVAPDAVAALLSDADHRPSRAVEVAGACNGVLPELDPDTRSLSLGVPCGELGAVAPLALVALAAAVAEREQAPVLALGVGADEQRVAVALSPPLPDADDTESTEANASPSTTPEPAAATA